MDTDGSLADVSVVTILTINVLAPQKYSHPPINTSRDKDKGTQSLSNLPHTFISLG